MDFKFITVLLCVVHIKDKLRMVISKVHVKTKFYFCVKIIFVYVYLSFLSDGIICSIFQGWGSRKREEWCLSGSCLWSNSTFSKCLFIFSSLHSFPASVSQCFPFFLTRSSSLLYPSGPSHHHHLHRWSTAATNGVSVFTIVFPSPWPLDWQKIKSFLYPKLFNIFQHHRE